MYIPVVFVYKKNARECKHFKATFLIYFSYPNGMNILFFEQFLVFEKQVVITRTRMNRHLSIRLDEKLYIDIHRMYLFYLVI